MAKSIESMATGYGKSLAGVGGDVVSQKRIRTTNSFARVVYWHYKKQYFGDATNVRLTPAYGLYDMDVGTLEMEIESVTTSKSINMPSGSFEISLLPSKNWKQHIFPGDWLLVFLFNGSEDSSDVKNKNIVMLGNVDRVSRTKQKDEQSDKTLVRFHIIGRDHGKVLEDTEIYFDPFAMESASSNLITTWLRQGVPLAGSANQLVGKLLDIFLSGKSIFMGEEGKKKLQTNPVEQWNIPSNLVGIFGSDFVDSVAGFSEPFHSSLKKILPSLPGVAQMIAMNPRGNGTLWQSLQRCSNFAINHLFVDLERNENGEVKPAITLRPRPNSVFFKDSPGMLNGAFLTIRDLPKIVVDPTDVLYENVGKNHQTSQNMVWLMPPFADGKASLNPSVNNRVGVGQIGNPMVLAESIQRYGLKRAEIMDIQFVYTSQGSALNVQAELLKSFLNQKYDHLVYNNLYETGTIETAGNIYAQLGKCLKILPETPDGVAKLYLIEGYKHTWKYPNQWRTEWMVTMGSWDSASDPFIDYDDDGGMVDKDFENLLAKTQLIRSGNEAPVAGSIASSVKKYESDIGIGGILA